MDCGLYMRIPASFHVTDNLLSFSDGKWMNNDVLNYVLKLKKNLYGLKQAGSNCFCKLRVLACGFMQRKIDPCLFLRKDIILIDHVDDCVLFACKPKLDNLISSLQQEFMLTDEGDVGMFLSLDIRQNEKGHLELMQLGLMENYSRVGLISELKEHGVPAITKILDKDEQEPERELE